MHSNNKETLLSQKANTFTEIKFILDHKESMGKAHKAEMLKTALSEYIQ